MALTADGKSHAWYGGLPGADMSQLAHDVFSDALAAFSNELSRDQKKLDWILDCKFGNLEEVLAAVVGARGHYEKQNEESATRDVLVNLTEKIHHYSGIMDVMIQHHPEYTSLAWGAMKVLFVGVVNHRNVVTRLATGLNQIADILPRAELFRQLYPIPQIKQVIVDIHAHILKFLMRALRWYQEGKLKHALHSITRPAELRYDDLLAKITSMSRSMTESAWASSHAEQRDMHIRLRDISTKQHDIHAAIHQLQNHHQIGMDQLTVERHDMHAAIQQLQNHQKIGMDQLTVLVLQMKESVATEQVINASARIELRQQLSQMQLVQFLNQIKVTALADPIKAFQSALVLHKRNRQRPSRKIRAFWLDAKFQNWNTSRESSLIIVKGTWQLRSCVQGFCTESIFSLRDASVPVIWALNTMIARKGTIMEDQASTTDLLKYLITQAVSINETLHIDAALTPCHGSYLSAKTEEEWMELLMSALEDIPKVYIVLDLEVLSRSLSSLTEDFWPSAFLRGFSELSTRSRTIVKVVLVSYGSPLFKGRLDNHLQDLVVPVGNRQSRDSARMPMPRGGAHAREKIQKGSRRRDFDTRLA